MKDRTNREGQHLVALEREAVIIMDEETSTTRARAQINSLEVKKVWWGSCYGRRGVEWRGKNCSMHRVAKKNKAEMI